MGPVKRRRVKLFETSLTTAEADDDNEDLSLSDDLEDISQLDENDGSAEFERIVRAWYDHDIPWRELYPSLPEDPHLIRDLMTIDLKVVMDHLNSLNRDNRFGHLPLMCCSSICQLGSLSSQSFTERMNSAGSCIVTEHKLRLDSDLIGKLVSLKMNKAFMEYVNAEKKRASNHVHGISAA